jgi:hypothetical protein
MPRRCTALVTRLTVVALACVAALALAPAKASATPVLWTLNATLSNGGTAAGSFVYDADTNLYSNVALTTTSPAASFDTSEIGGPFSATASSLELIDGFVPGANFGKPTLILHFVSPGLTNLGGPVTLDILSLAGVCAFPGCMAVFADGVGFARGEVIGTPASAVPEPATLFLCSAGLVGAGVRRWRQRRA